MLSNTFYHHELSRTQRIGLIKLQPKPGAKTDLQNWRPIAVLITDYKIIGTLVAEILCEQTQGKISINQKWALKGRNIADIHQNILASSMWKQFDVYL